MNNKLFELETDQPDESSSTVPRLNRDAPDATFNGPTITYFAEQAKAAMNLYKALAPRVAANFKKRKIEDASAEMYIGEIEVLNYKISVYASILKLIQLKFLELVKEKKITNPFENFLENEKAKNEFKEVIDKAGLSLGKGLEAIKSRTPHGPDGKKLDNNHHHARMSEFAQKIDSANPEEFFKFFKEEFERSLKDDKEDFISRVDGFLKNRGKQTEKPDEEEPGEEQIRKPTTEEIKNFLEQSKGFMSIILQEPSLLTSAKEGQGLQQTTATKINQVYLIGNDYFEGLSKNDGLMKTLSICAPIFKTKNPTKQQIKNLMGLPYDNIEEAFKAMSTIADEKFKEQKTDLGRLAGYYDRLEPQEPVDAPKKIPNSSEGFAPARSVVAYLQSFAGTQTEPKETAETYLFYYKWIKENKPELVELFTAEAEPSSTPTEEPEEEPNVSKEDKIFISNLNLNLIEKNKLTDADVTALGQLLRAVNQVSESLEEEHPDVYKLIASKINDPATLEAIKVALNKLASNQQVLQSFKARLGVKAPTKSKDDQGDKPSPDQLEMIKKLNEFASPTALKFNGVGNVPDKIHAEFVYFKFTSEEAELIHETHDWWGVQKGFFVDNARDYVTLDLIDSKADEVIFVLFNDYKLIDSDQSNLKWYIVEPKNLLSRIAKFEEDDESSEDPDWDPSDTSSEEPGPSEIQEQIIKLIKPYLLKRMKTKRIGATK